VSVAIQCEAINASANWVGLFISVQFMWCEQGLILVACSLVAYRIYVIHQGSQTHLSMWATVEDNSQSAGRTTKCNCFTQHSSHCSWKLKSNACSDSLLTRERESTVDVSKYGPKTNNIFSSEMDNTSSFYPWTWPRAAQNSFAGRMRSACLRPLLYTMAEVNGS